MNQRITSAPLGGHSKLYIALEIIPKPGCGRVLPSASSSPFFAVLLLTLVPNFVPFI